MNKATDKQLQNRTYVFHTDAGHGWLAVPYSHLAHLGIADKITCYSYVHGLTIYLEEDCDVTTFVQAYTERYGYVPAHRMGAHSDYSRIRSYPGYGFTP